MISIVLDTPHVFHMPVVLVLLAAGSRTALPDWLLPAHVLGPRQAVDGGAVSSAAPPASATHSPGNRAASPQVH